ncbi:polymer-forming cytoskeletal protein [Gangjinia marincola]|uniref:Polymer-forming cytoskeletal protein n=1 Tax=Gangjinia marincola TaxID=578463 RepID=A0ABN1MIL8_9FLAO
MFSEKKQTASADLSKEQNKISQGTTIKGDIIAKGGFRIEGNIEGTVKTPGKVVVGRSGYINGSLECENADFEGKFNGKLNVSGTLTLRSTAHIEGDVVIGKLAVEPGANFNATCSMKGGVKSLSNDQKKERTA